MSEAPPLIAVVGATASGKTSLALELAARLGTEIVSADAMQFYRGLEIGTAAPTAAELARAPHHFVSCLAPGEGLPAGRYGPEVRAVIARINDAGRPAVLVGGSGLYVRAVIDGIFEGPGRDAALRARLRDEAVSLGNDAMLARLRAVDPNYATQLTSANDLVRIVRALEVHAVTGEPFSAWHARHQAEASPLRATQVALDYPDRTALYGRINRRVDAMIAAGWLDEVRRLLDAGHGPWLESLKALGYRELAAHLRGEQSLAAAVEAAKLHHRRYAKRQLSWFRNDPRVHWITADADPAALADRALALWRDGD